MKSQLFRMFTILICILICFSTNAKAGNSYNFYHGSNFSDGHSPVRLSNGGFGLINKKGELIASFPKATHCGEPSNGMVWIIMEMPTKGFKSEYAFYNIETKKLNKIFAYNVEPFSEDFCLIQVGIAGDMVLMNKEGKFVSKTHRNSSHVFSEGIWTIQDDNNVVLLGPDGKKIAKSPKGISLLSYSYGFKEGLLAVKDRNDFNKSKFLDKAGKIALDGKSWKIAMPFSGGFSVIKTNEGEIGCIDKTGEFRFLSKKWTSLGYYYNDRVVCVIGELDFRDKAKRKYGVLDTKGNLITPATWDNIEKYSDNGFALAKKNGKQYFIDKEGKISLEVINTFHKAESFRNGLAKITEKDDIFFIDPTGKIVLPLNRKGEQVAVANP